MYLLFKVDDMTFAIEGQNIEQIIFPEQISAMPDTTPEVLGTTTYLGKPMAVVSLHKLFNLRDSKHTYNNFLEMRKAHEEWLNNVEHNRDVETNPHQCSFAKLFDHYEPTRDSLRILVDSIKPVHAEMHKLIADKSNKDKVLQLGRKTVLPLIDKMIEEYKSISRGMMIVIEDEEKSIILQVDEVLTLERNFEVKEIPLKSCKYTTELLIVDGKVSTIINAKELISSYT